MRIYYDISSYDDLYDDVTMTFGDVTVTWWRHNDPMTSQWLDEVTMPFYGVTMTFTLASLIFAILLLIHYRKRLEGNSLPWFLAACLGIGSGLVMLVEMKTQINYSLYNFIEEVFVLQLLTITAGYFIYWLRLHPKSFWYYITIFRYKRQPFYLTFKL